MLLVIIEFMLIIMLLKSLGFDGNEIGTLSIPLLALTVIFVIPGILVGELDTVIGWLECIFGFIIGVLLAEWFNEKRR